MLFGVFDGHGGKDVAEYARENFKKTFVKHMKKKSENDFKSVLEQTMLDLDNVLKNKSFAMDAGTTANVVFVTKDTIYCANVGDSRAVLCSNSKAVPLSVDHKPTNEKEKSRI